MATAARDGGRGVAQTMEGIAQLSGTMDEAAGRMRNLEAV